MNSQQFPPWAAALCVCVSLAALLAGFASAGPDIVKSEDRFVASPAADDEFARIARAMANRVVASADAATLPVLVTAAAANVAAPAPAIDTPAAADKPDPIVVAALPDASQVPPEPQPVQAALANAPDPAPGDEGVVSVIAILDECLVLEVCVDHYLYALYERTAKQDTSKVHERRKVKVWRKGKTITVTRRFIRLVPEDFTWKDPKAAERAGMSMMDYVIGGMDRSFKLKLFHALRAAELAGLAPGITSGFRDDFRQSIASGLKAAANRSYHGGSLRGGYGHGVAADIVSVKGATKPQRWVSTDILWKWIDANEQQFGVGRPYLDRDPPHVAPLDGEEYASRRGTKTQVAQANVKKKPARVAAAKPKKTVRAASAAGSAKRAVPSGRPTVASATR